MFVCCRVLDQVAVIVHVQLALKASVFGVWPMATKTHFTSSSRSAPVHVFGQFHGAHLALLVGRGSPVMAVFQTGSILGLRERAVGHDFEARSLSRRWTR